MLKHTRSIISHLNTTFLAFDIWGDFAHFKKFYTTSSPLTFCIPTPTALYGILSAILGFDKKEYANFINAHSTTLALQVLNPIKKIRTTFNYIDTKNSGSFNLIKNRTQIKTELLKDPKYRIFVNHKDKDIFEKLIYMIKHRKNVYTVSLGLANMIANFRFVGIYEATPVETSQYLDSIVLLENVESIDINVESIDNSKKHPRFLREKIPISIDTKRVVDVYKDVIVETQGLRIKGVFKNSYMLEDQTIISPYNLI
ncbi:MAG: type I-B CRISPR-associated protein Cas5b [Hydrogenobaculum sp.]